MRSVEQLRGYFLTALLPPGEVWPRDEKSNLGRLIQAVCGPIIEFEHEVDGLKTEINPGTSTRLLADYERVLGADPCNGDTSAMTVEERQKIAFRRWVLVGGQSLQFYKELADQAGVVLHITEIHPYVCNGDDAVCGSALCSLESDWNVVIFHFLSKNSALECAIKHNLPPTTIPVFQYAG